MLPGEVQGALCSGAVARTTPRIEESPPHTRVIDQTKIDPVMPLLILGPDVLAAVSGPHREHCSQPDPLQGSGQGIHRIELSLGYDMSGTAQADASMVKRTSRRVPARAHLHIERPGGAENPDAFGVLRPRGFILPSRGTPSCLRASVTLTAPHAECFFVAIWAGRHVSPIGRSQATVQRKFGRAVTNLIVFLDAHPVKVGPGDACTGRLGARPVRHR